MAARRGKSSGLKVVYRSPMGTTVWAIPGSDLQIMWAGPGAGLQIGRATVAGGHVARIEHPTADGHYATAREAGAAAKAFVDAGARSGDRRRHGSRRVCASYGDVHPAFPRVVVYLYRHQGGFRVIAKVKKDYHSLWRTVERGGTTTVAGALAEARAMGRMYERKYKTPEPYELVHGAPGA